MALLVNHRPFFLAAILLGLISYALAALGNRDIAEILNTMNTLRSNVVPSASNMQTLVWNEELAAAAQFFSDKCKLGSNPDRNSSVPSFNSVGETVSVSGSSSISYANFINMAWIVRQITRYDFESNTCGGSSNACSDYIQIVWAETTDVGCGATICSYIPSFPASNSVLFVCYYGPAGNILEEHPYLTGTPCSQCRTDQICNKKKCATTDVQGVNVCLLFGGTYSIQCSYIAGSIASMCSYAFESVKEGTRDINSIIEENGSVNENIPDINDYGRILVYDKNNILVMNETLDLKKIGYCHKTENATNPTIATNASNPTIATYATIATIAGIATIPTIAAMATNTFFGSGLRFFIIIPLLFAGLGIF